MLRGRQVPGTGSTRIQHTERGLPSQHTYSYMAWHGHAPATLPPCCAHLASFPSCAREGAAEGGTRPTAQRLELLLPSRAVPRGTKASAPRRTDQTSDDQSTEVRLRGKPFHSANTHGYVMAHGRRVGETK